MYGHFINDQKQQEKTGNVGGWESMSLSRIRWRFYLNISTASPISTSKLSQRKTKLPEILSEGTFTHKIGNQSVEELKETKLKWPNRDLTDLLYHTLLPKCWCSTEALIVMTRSDAIGGQRTHWYFWRHAWGSEGGNERVRERTEEDFRREEQRRSERGSEPEGQQDNEIYLVPSVSH